MTLLSTVAQVVSTAATQALLVPQPLGKTAALKCAAMNYVNCDIAPLIVADPLDLNCWTCSLSIFKAPKDIDSTEVSIVLPNFNQTGLLVEVIGIIVQPLQPLNAGTKNPKSLPPSVSIAPQVNLKYWENATKDALNNKNKNITFYSEYKFDTTAYDITKLYDTIPRNIYVTIAFKGSDGTSY